MRILVLGGGYAGMMAALRLGNRGHGANVTLVNGSAEFAERVRHHELAAAKQPKRRPIAHLLRDTGVQLVVGKVVALDLEWQSARLADGRELDWHRLVFALGSVASDAGVPGVREHALLIGDESGAARMRETHAQRTVVVGGGLTGVEIAAELARQSSVTLMTANGVGPFLSAKGQAYLRERLTAMGVRILEARVREVRAGEVELEHGETLPGLCVWAGGFEAPPLARTSGLRVNGRGQILVDERLRSLSHPSVYAVGDAAEPQFDAGAPIRMGCKYAMPMAVHAAENLARATAGLAQQPFRFGDTGFCISLGREDGLIQLNASDGTPGGILTGRLAAWIKEQVCRFTVWAIQLERCFAFYRWRTPPLPAHEPQRLTA
ncbi:MAG TPA: FAD-dependent oxidoreductase [Polyangiaceae bacterium]